MTAAERSELAELRGEMAARFDRIDGNIAALDARMRAAESFVSSEQGRRAAREGYATGRLQWIGVAVAFAVSLIAVPGAVVAVLQIAGVLG